MKFLALVPKQVWMVLAGLIIGAMVVITSYDKGVQSEKTRWQLKTEQAISQEVATRLEKVNKSLDSLITLTKARDDIINNQNNQLNASEKRSSELQELLDEVLSNPNSVCPTTPDDEYRLYESILNEERP